MKKKHAAGYLVALACIAVAVALVMLPNGSNVLAQQQTNNTSNGAMMALMPSGGQQMSQNPNSTRMSSANWTSSVSLFSPMIDAIKAKIHTTLNDATTNALKTVGGGSNTSVVASIYPSRKRIPTI